MRNSTMRDKLASVLGAGVPIPLTGARARQLREPELRHKPRPYMESRKPVTVEVESPRYIVPPKKAKPFAVHVYPVVSPFAKRLSSLKVAEEEAPEIEVKEEPPKVEAKPEAEMILEPEPVAEPEVLPEPEAVVEKEITPEPEAVIQEAAKPLLMVKEKEAVIESPSQRIVPPIEVKAEAPQSVDSSPTKTALPPDLKWLEKPTPFVGDLQSIVGRVRDAKTRIAFTLEQLRGREVELQKQYEKLHADLDSVQFQIEQHRDYCHQLDEMIAACALVAEQSAAIDSNLFKEMSIHAGHSNHTKTPAEDWRRGPRGKTARWSDDPTYCHRKDVVEILQTDTHREWRAADVRDLLPEIKKKHGRGVIPGVLANLVNEGIMRRASLGAYRFVEDKAEI